MKNILIYFVILLVGVFAAFASHAQSDKCAPTDDVVAAGTGFVIIPPAPEGDPA